MTPLLVLAEFGCSETGDTELRAELDRTLRETRGVDGCLQATVWERAAERRFLFVTYWSDAAALRRWVENDFHRTVLMPAFRKWCVEGSFSEFDAAEPDHARARKCPSCGRWSQAKPGWSEAAPATCRQCGASLSREPGAPAAPALEEARKACIDAALAAYEDASLRGVCHEGAWEAAVGAMRTVRLGG
jgi:quinol monooxygenase YgiN